MNSLVPILVCVLFVITFGALLLSIARLFGKKVIKHSSIKERPYECGVVEESKDITRVPVQFYLTAILFVLFDIEIVFLYPYAIAFQDFIDNGEGMRVFFAMGFFLLIFIYGLWWEISSKALNWK